MVSGPYLTSTGVINCVRWAIVVLGITSLGGLVADGPLGVQAHPWPGHAKHATHRTRLLRRGLSLESYYPKSQFKTYPRGKTNSDFLTTPPTSGAAGSSFISGGGSEALNETPGTWRLNDAAVSFMSSELGINSTSVHYHKGWSGPCAQYAYMKQYIDGIPVANAVANLAYNNDSKIVSYGSSFINTEGATIAPSIPSMSWTDMIPDVEDSFGGKFTGSPESPPTVEYLAKPDGSVALTYVMQVKNESSDVWVEAFVCAHSGQLLSVTDFTAFATYNVVPIHKQNFFDGREIIKDPEDPEASPDGWLAPVNQQLGVTSGNNIVLLVDASDRVDGQQVSDSSSRLEQFQSGDFNNPYDPDDPLSLDGLDATIDNAFYVMNTMHDLSYRYGFQENQGNFQLDNFGKKGANGTVRASRDPVVVSIRDRRGLNNAVFSTPPEGSPPTAKFFFFQTDGAIRDSAFANDVLVHEFTHGVTNRLTGGGTARCLQSLESGGMGEGWSDMMAVWVGQTNATVRDFKVGTYFRPQGIRSKPYSTDASVNPLMYSDIGKLKEVHEIGEVWANTLYNVYADLVKERGFSTNAFIDTDGTEGNIVFMHNMIDGLLLQPCNPSVLQARDAILKADEIRYQGANQCTMLKAFARKGMGMDATDDFKDGFEVPEQCGC